MMAKNTTLLIERVGNGFMVRPNGHPDMPWALEDMVVFQDKGLVQSTRPDQPLEATLLGWLDKHFPSEDASNKRGLTISVEVTVGQYPVGATVAKVGGDYTFEGTVVAAFRKTSGAMRYVVEDDRGVLHVYSDKSLRPR